MWVWVCCGCVVCDVRCVGEWGAVCGSVGVGVWACGRVGARVGVDVFLCFFFFWVLFFNFKVLVFRF